MTSNPLVSVIIPTYNREEYIKTCLDVMISQSYKNLEIIVVDDGSTDNSVQKISEYPVRLLIHEKNRGQSAARNTGIDAAKGDFIHFMDVDDLINLDFYSKMVEAAVETGSDMACCGMIHQRARHKTQLFKHRKVYTGTDEKLTVTYVGKWGYTVRYLFRTDFLKKHNMRFEEGRIIEDLIFSLPAVYYADKLVVVPGAEYTYVFAPNSTLTSKDRTRRKKVHEDKKYAKQRNLDFAKAHNFKIPGINKGVARYILRKMYSKLFGQKEMLSQ